MLFPTQTSTVRAHSYAFICDEITNDACCSLYFTTRTSSYTYLLFVELQLPLSENTSRCHILCRARGE